MVTKNGSSIYFSEGDVRKMGRPTAGVVGIRLKPGDELISMDKAAKENELLVVTEKGLGKKSKIADWPAQKRAGSGVKAAEVTARTGKIMAALVLYKEDKNFEDKDFVVTSKMGQVIKSPLKDVPVLTRQTQGVILIRLANKNDSVAAVTSLSKEPSPSTDKAGAKSKGGKTRGEA